MLASILRQLLRRRQTAQPPQPLAIDEQSIDEGMTALADGKLELAVRCFHEHLARHPDDAAAHNNLGVALQRLGRTEEALASYERAARIAPGTADAWYNKGLAHHLQRDLAQAEQCYRKAIEADSSCAEAHREYSMLRLAQGEFAPKVWASFRQRRLCPGFAASVTECPAVPWSGEPLAGKKILVYGEQGLGDEILFASCYPDLIAAADSCVIETEPRLEALFRRSFATAAVLGRHRAGELQEHYRGVAYTVPGGDLPLYFRPSASAFPGRPAYLRADADAVARWRAALSGIGAGLKVGISWRGGTPRTNQTRRSVEIEQWRPVFEIPGVRFVSLQYGECAADLACAQEVFGTDVCHWPEAIADYDETAALVSALDLVITVTTSVAHLSGALGQRTWILANAAPRWCYLASGTAIPWYPAARIFRQGTLKEWGDVMGRVAAALRELSTQPIRSTE